MLAAVTVGCVWLGWNAEKATRQRAAVLEIRDAGAAVYYDYQLKYHNFAYEGRIVSLPITNNNAVPPWPLIRRFIGDDFLNKASFVQVINLDARKSVCKCLPRLPYLRRLEIHHGVDDDGATRIAQCSSLREFSVDNARLSNRGLTLLTRLKLRSITISNSDVTEEGVGAFRSMNPNCDIWLNRTWVP
jgi:hypothetical protein